MKKSDMTFSPYQLELLGDFYRSNFSVSRFAQEKGIARITFWRWVRIFEDSNPEISAYMKRTSLPSPRMNPPQLLPYVLRMSVYVQSLKMLKCVRTPSIR